MQRRADFRRVSGGQHHGGSDIYQLVAGCHGRGHGADIVRYRGSLMLGGHQRKAEFAAHPGDEFYAFKLLPEDMPSVVVPPYYNPVRQSVRYRRTHRSPQRDFVRELFEDDEQIHRAPPVPPRRAEANNAENHNNRGEGFEWVHQVLQPPYLPNLPDTSPPLELRGKLVLTLLGVNNVGVFSQTVDCSGQICEHRQCFPFEALESSLSDLFSVEPTFVVSYEFKSAEEQATFGDADKTLIVSSLAKCLGRARDFASYADITIRVDGIEFKAHMVVLAAQSEVFHAMFESNMCERAEGVLELEDTNPEAVDAMLKYMYGRDLACIQEDLMVAVDLLRLANKYNIEGLQGACEKIIRTKDKEDVDMRTALHIFLCGFL